MTEKRYSYFKSEITGLFVISDEIHRETFSGMEDEYNCSRIVRKLNILSEENEQLKQQLFEARRDYLIETADISDKLYLDDEIEKERKEIFGDVE